MHQLLTLVATAGGAGALVPLVAAVLTQVQFSRATNSLIALLVSVAAAVGSAYETGKLSGLSVAAFLSVIYPMAQSIYQHAYEPIGVTPWLQELTSFRMPRLGRRRRQVQALTAQVEALSKALAEAHTSRTIVQAPAEAPAAEVPAAA